jgi:hypothetical protein
MTLETIIRPFQTNDVAPARPYFNAGQVGVPNVIMQFGRSGQGKTFSGSYSARQTIYMTEYNVEHKSPFTSPGVGSFTGRFAPDAGQPFGQSVAG